MATAAWRRVQGWPYEVSDAGNVRRIGGRPLAPRRHSNGYLRVCLCRNEGERADAYIHRLVCTAFHGEPAQSNMHADHINGRRDDNAATNLRWLTPADNRARRLVAKGEGHSSAKLTEADVRLIRVSAESNSQLGKRFGVSRRTIADARIGKTWGHVNA